MYANIIIPVALPGYFTYRVPSGLQPSIGSGVLVPFGKTKTHIGIVHSFTDTAPAGIDIKDIAEIAHTRLCTTQQLQLWEWIASYYVCSIGEVMKAALPAPLRRGEIKQRKSNAKHSPIPSQSPSVLSSSQQQAYNDIHTIWQTKSTALLHGVTASGKTEIYVHLIKETIAAGKQVLYLLPEIALTTQLTTRLQQFFDNEMCVYHSGYTDTQRKAIWLQQLGNEAHSLVLGARSAVLLPFCNLGLIIVDEEHETTYKQADPAPRYHARNVALMMAQQAGARVLLGSATPSIESYYMAQTGKYGLASLTHRYADVLMPNINIVDMKDLRRRKLVKGNISTTLREGIEAALDRREQVILFQNRRGFAPMLECKICGWVPQCPDCSVSLTYHKTTHSLRCHYCGHTEDAPYLCPHCEKPTISARGVGTQRVEDEIMRLFPNARVARLDADTAHTKNQYTQALARFEAGEIDILIGTQLLSKGLDFDNVSLVGIIDADSMLNLPDFRAHERAFQLITQVSGRAGRRATQGQVIIQTRSIDHPQLSYILSGDYSKFYADQIQERQLFDYPPIHRLIYIYVKHRDIRTCHSAACHITSLLSQYFNHLHGPIEPPIARIGRLYIRLSVLKIPRSVFPDHIRQVLHYAQSTALAQHSATIYYDIDPV